VDDLFALYSQRVPPFSDLVCYWFEKARAQIELGKAKRAGLLATQSIRGGVNRHVLDRIKEKGDIFWAQSDREWLLDGATVHVSMIGFDDRTISTRFLDGQPAPKINADLTAGVDVVGAESLTENANICFMGPSPKARFDISEEIAAEMLSAPLNVNKRPNSDVVRPVASAVDLVQNCRRVWTIDFGLMSKSEAACYETPFEYVRRIVYPVRKRNRRKVYADKWWIYGEPRPGMRQALKGLSRCIATPAVSKHRIYVWVRQEVLCNQGTFVFAREDDYFLGILHSRIHEIWARRKGTQLREAVSGFRYTPTTTFETFPFPFSPEKEPENDPRVVRIANAAKMLAEKRDCWLNPPSISPQEAKKRTLTNLYNQKPSWLSDVHCELDNAVLTAYGWPQNLTEDEMLNHLLSLNAERSAKQESKASSKGERYPRRPPASVPRDVQRGIKNSR
jgi:hypothetical protein